MGDITKHKIPCARTTFLASMEKQQHLDTATNLDSFHVTQSPCKKVISCCLQTGVIHHKPYVRKPPLPRQTVATTPPSCEAVRRCALPSVVWLFGKGNLAAPALPRRVIEGRSAGFARLPTPDRHNPRHSFNHFQLPNTGIPPNSLLWCGHSCYGPPRGPPRDARAAPPFGARASVHSRLHLGFNVIHQTRTSQT